MRVGERNYAAEDEIDIRELALGLWRRRWVILGFALATALAAAAASWLALPRLYEAQVLLLVSRPQIQTVDPNSPAFRTGELNIVAPLNLELPAESVVALARGDRVRDEVARRTGVDRERLRKGLFAQAIRNTNLVALRVRLPDPLEAQKVATSWADIVVDRSNALLSVRATTSHSLFTRLTLALTRLRTAERVLRDFDATSRIDELQARLAKLVDQLAAYENRHNDLAVALTRAQQELVSIEAQIREEPRTFTLSKTIAADPFLHEALSEASRRSFVELSRLKLRTEEQNPVYNALNQARANAAVAVEALRAEKLGVERAIREIRGEIAELRTELAKQMLMRTRLVREVDNARKVYDALFQRSEEARVAVATQAGMVQVALPAARPEQPVSPRPALNAAVAGTLAFLPRCSESWSATLGLLHPGPSGRRARRFRRPAN